MPQNKTALALNPIRVVRESQGKTLQQFSDRIGCTLQTLYLNESGVYPTILPVIKRYLTNKLQLDARQLDLDYMEFVSETRRVFGRTYSPLTTLPEPRVGDSPIVKWRESLGLSQVGLAKALCIQPVLISRIERKQALSLPQEFKNALKEADVPKYIIEELEYRVEEYYYS